MVAFQHHVHHTGSSQHKGKRQTHREKENKTEKKKEKHRKKRARDTPSKETNPTQKHCTILTKTSGYLDSLHVNQEVRQRQTK